MRMKKGVSPVIAVLLMIAITVAIGILVYVWVSGLAGSMTSGGGTQVAEQLELIAYDFHDTNTLILYVKNTGGIAVTIDRIYFGTSGGTFTVTTSFTTSGDFTDSTLNPGGVGSITKTLTAISVLQLVEKGLLNLEDPVEKYTGLEMRVHGEKVLIHHLLTHTSGIPALGYAEAFIRSSLGLGGTWLPVSRPEQLTPYIIGAGEWAAVLRRS